MTHPTILHLPQWLGVPEHIALPLPPADYLLREVQPDWWQVVAKPTGETIYTGLGPVSLEPTAAARAAFSAASALP